MQNSILHWNTVTLPNPETETGAQAKADAAKDAAIAAAAQDAAAKAAAVEAEARSYAEAQAASTLQAAKQYADSMEIDWNRVTNKPDQATRWPSWSEVTDKPSAFPPSAHSHAASDLPSATTSEKGIVRLTSSTSSDSETLAATAKAVKAAFDRAVTAENNAKAYADSIAYNGDFPLEKIMLKKGNKVFELTVDDNGSLITTLKS